LWQADGRTLDLEPLSAWHDGNRLPCSFSGSCHEHFLAFDGDGAVYNCGRFADADLAWGNIADCGLAEMLGHPIRDELARRSTRLLEGHCKGCDFWGHCRGGCPSDAYVSSGEVAGPSHFCESYRILFRECGFPRAPAPKKERCG